MTAEQAKKIVAEEAVRAVVQAAKVSPRASWAPTFIVTIEIASHVAEAAATEAEAN